MTHFFQNGVSGIFSVKTILSFWLPKSHLNHTTLMDVTMSHV